VERVVSKAQRVSREDLISITNSYFDSLSARDGHVMIAHPGCVRLETLVSYKMSLKRGLDSHTR